MGEGGTNAAFDSGVELFKQGKAADALPLLQQAVELEPSSIQARSYLGACCSQLGKHEDALAQFKELTDLQPNVASHYFNLGYAYQSCGKKPDAMTAYSRAVAINPGHDKAKAALDALKAENEPVPVQTTAVPTPPVQPTIGSAPAAPSAPAPQSYSPPQPQGFPSAGQGYTAPPPPVIPRASGQVAELEKKVHSGANWFYWIAGVSLVNMVIALFNVGFHFVVGLGATGLLDQIGRESQKLQAPFNLAIVCVPISLILIAVYAVLGYCASKKMRWAFITGIVFYALDSVLFVLMFMSIIGIIFHILALIGLVGGLKAAGQIQQIETQMATQARAQAYQQTGPGGPPSSPLA